MSHLLISLGIISALLLGGILNGQRAKSEDFPGELLIEETDFGPADFGEIEEGMPSSYHDAWCKQLHRKCRVRFSGRSMTVEGFNGITREQLKGFRSSYDGGERYFYVRYINSRGKLSNALFLFVHNGAAAEFGYALARWYDQDPRPVPNFRYPNSQGPQDTHGRDGGMNPYDQIGD